MALIKYWSYIRFWSLPTRKWLLQNRKIFYGFRLYTLPMQQSFHFCNQALTNVRPLFFGTEKENQKFIIYSSLTPPICSFSLHCNVNSWSWRMILSPHQTICSRKMLKYGLSRQTPQQMKWICVTKCKINKLKRVVFLMMVF